MSDREFLIEVPSETGSLSMAGNVSAILNKEAITGHSTPTTYYPFWMVGLVVLALSFISACIIYYVGSRQFGTPFANSLTEKQIQIKTTSSRQRSILFGGAFAGSIIVIALLFFFFLK